MPAKFVKNDNSCLCNICAETIVSTNAVGLKCNPSKHIFCYECILDWYKELNKNKNFNNYSIKNMCPICRKNGGLLPVHTKFKSIKGIHDIKEVVLPVIIETSKSSIPDINPDKLPNKCGAKLKTKNGYCESTGKSIYGGFCGRHSNCNVQQTTITSENIIQDNTQIV
jgi:hypothetical protein